MVMRHEGKIINKHPWYGQPSAVRYSIYAISPPMETDPLAAPSVISLSSET